MLIHFEQSYKSQNTDELGGVGADLRGPRSPGDFDDFTGVLVSATYDDGLEPGDVKDHGRSRDQVQPEVVAQEVALLDEGEGDHLEAENAHADDGHD